MSKLIKLINKGASINKIKANLWDNRDNSSYIDFQDENGMTALMHACKGHLTRFVELFLESTNVNVNLLDNSGLTALAYTVLANNAVAARMLLNHDSTLFIYNGQQAVWHLFDESSSLELRSLIESNKSKTGLFPLVFEAQENFLYEAQSNISYCTKDVPIDSIFKNIDLSSFEPTWSVEQQSSFIKSLLLGIPTQLSIFTRNDCKSIIVLDGKNRVYAIHKFLYDDLSFCDNNFLVEFKGMRYSNLSASIKRELLERTIRTIDFANKSVSLVAKTLGITHDTN